MKSFSLFLLVASIFLTGCNEDRFKEIPTYLRGTRDINGVTTDVSAVQFGLRRGDVFFRVRFQVFEASAKALPEVISLRFKDDNSSKLWIDFENRNTRNLELSVGSGCAERKNPQVQLCWGKEGVELKAELPEGIVQFDLKQDTGESLRTRQKTAPFTVDELVGQARFRNYTSLQEAERVFQAKERIRETRGNLLPHFNMRDLISVVTDGPIGLTGAVGELLPFIFPTHWMKWSKSLEYYQAEILSFAALLGNEMSAVEEMTYAIHRDQAVLKFLDQKIASLKSYEEQIQKFESRGMLRAGTALDFQLDVRALEQDRRQMQTLIEKQLSAIAHATGLRPIGDKLTLEDIPLPDLQYVNLPDAGDLAEKSKDRSMEIGTLHFLRRAALINTEEKRFGFLDPASEDVIGFGYASSLRISGSQVKEIEIQIEAMRSLVEQRVSDIISDMREAVDLYRSAQAGIDGVNQRFDQEIRLPQERGMLRGSDPKTYGRIYELSREALLYESTRLSSVHAYMIAKAKVDRLLGEGFYQGLEVVSLPKDGRD